MIITAPRGIPAIDAQVVSEVLRVIDRRAALKHPPPSLTVSDSVALGIAELFSSPTVSGRVLDRFATGASVDADELIEAARFEQSFASPEGYAALRCLVLWVQNRMQRQGVRASLSQRGRRPLARPSSTPHLLA